MTDKQPDANFTAGAGQASWANPASNHTCGECLNWSRPGERVSRSRYDYFGKHDRMMRGRADTLN